MDRRWSQLARRMILGLAMLAGVAGMMAANVSATAQGAEPAAQIAAQPRQTAAPEMDGHYRGRVDLTVAVPGTLNDSPPTPSPDRAGASTMPELGQIDLALHLEQDGRILMGKLDLENSLVFGVLSDDEFWPTLEEGRTRGDQFYIRSKPFAMTINGRTVTRQFALNGAHEHTDTESILTGRYSETITGYARYPFTVHGQFTLHRPLASQESSE